MGSKRTHQDEETEELGECSTFTVSGFYGSTRPSVTARMREKIVRVSKATKHMEQRPLPSGYNPGVLGPPSTWKTFTRQAEAIKYSQLQGEGLLAFSYEGDAVGSGGKRNFVVAHPRLMWFRLCERHPKQRCSYEVIQELSVCKLYFDLEFSFLYNQDREGSAMVDTFIQIVCYFIQKEFGIHCGRENIVDLSSSTFLKFSRHLIFNLPDTAFATNIHVGNFVIMVCNKIREWYNENPIEIPGVKLEDIKKLFVQNAKHSVVLFCDEGVYTKNRNFRLLHSTKLGKNTPLVVAPENQYIPALKNGVSKDEQLFLDSLVTTVEESSKVLTYGENNGKVQRLQSNDKILGNVSGMDRFGSSPYQEIDGYIQRVVQPGYIRCWFYFSQSELLVYEVAQNKYCHNIGREHRSNGVMYVVNLKSGTYYQKCHDPDCRDFRSDVWQLPESVVFWKKFNDDDMMGLVQSVEDFNDSEDELLLRAVNKAEFEEMDISDDELCSLASKLEMWDNIDMMSSKSGSFQGSQHSTQSLSQKSNPWDRLSQLSTPDSSYFASLSEMAFSVNELSQRETTSVSLRKFPSGTGSECANIFENDWDEEFAREAARVEEEERQPGATAINSEVEFQSFEMAEL